MPQGITLVNPDSPFLHEPKTMPPLGLLYVASSLKAGGVKVGFVDLAGLGVRPIPDGDFYGITATTPQFLNAVKVLRLIKTVNPGAQVCVGGRHATLCPEECLRAGFDAAIVGDGELAIHDFLEGGRGVIKHEVEDIDSVFFPDRSLVKDYDYWIDGERATTMMTSRGCPFRCGFCCKTWGGVRFRSWDNVTKELEEIKEMGYGGVMFYDDEMLIGWGRDEKIFRNLSRLDLVWRCFTRADLVTKHMADIMSTCGCKEILIGVESGSDVILKSINKGTTVKQNMEAIKTLHGAGIRVKVAMIVMLPGESEKTMEETWGFCEEVESYVSAWDFTICTPYPGSPIYEHPAKYDFYFDESAVYSAYKGAGSPQWKPPRVWTSKLAFEEGLSWRDWLEKRFKFKG